MLLESFESDCHTAAAKRKKNGIWIRKLLPGFSTTMSTSFGMWITIENKRKSQPNIQRMAKNVHPLRRFVTRWIFAIIVIQHALANSAEHRCKALIFVHVPKINPTRQRQKKFSCLLFGKNFEVEEFVWVDKKAVCNTVEGSMVLRNKVSCAAYVRIKLNFVHSKNHGIHTFFPLVFVFQSNTFHWMF